MEKKILLLNYFLCQATDLVQKEFGIDDTKVALLFLIFAKANVFRRYTSGCGSENILICRTQYAEDLFWLVCLDAKAHGYDLLKYYQPRASYLFGGQKQWGAPILTDSDVQKQWEKIYPAAAPEQELYTRFVASKEISKIQKSTSVSLSALELPAQDADTAAIDSTMQRLQKKKSFVKLFSVTNKFDFYGRSNAHKYYAEHYSAEIPAV